MHFEFLLIHVFILLSDVISLRLTRLVIPTYKFRGENAILECDFDLNGKREADKEMEKTNYNFDDQTEEEESLYSVKWYKDNEEFYRFVPKANPPQNSYKVDGIKVDHQASNSKKVYLKGVTLKSTGFYRCEVSAEAPAFSSVQGEAKMEVVYLPKDGPHISGEEKQYQIGDILSLNCTSGKSQPRSVLSWYINDEQVTNTNYLVNYRDIYHNHGLVTTSLGLNIPVDGRHFYDGMMRVRCVASLSPSLWQNGKESVVQRRPALMDNREAMLLETSCGLRLWKTVIPPVKIRGDNVLLECQYELNNSSTNNQYNNHNHRQHYRKNNYLYYDNNEEEEESLYSVKWYKDNEEFYRFVPKANPPQHSYKFDGIKVDHKLSDSTKVYLKNISLKASGLYRCEVSAEAPSFSSVQGEGHMQVVYLPTSGPFMQGEEIAYESGDKLNLNCSSAKSFPASHLQFYINDDPIINPKYIISYPEVQHPHGLVTTILGLKLRINSQYFEDGAMRIKCVASISPVLKKRTVMLQKHQMINLR
ncbi:unnamed protein product, partial [Diamesa hyperborea]